MISDHPIIVERTRLIHSGRLMISDHPIIVERTRLIHSGRVSRISGLPFGFLLLVDRRGRVSVVTP
jgi:hypothetical protein